MSVGAEGGNTSRKEHEDFALTDGKQNRECLEDAQFCMNLKADEIGQQ